MSEPLLTLDGVTRRRMTIANQRGLHARAAARFVKTAERFEAEILVGRVEPADLLCCGDERVSGRSIMGLMMLAASIGTIIEVGARGADAEAALDALEQLVANKFDEE